MSANTTTAPETVIVTRRVRHGRAAEFESPLPASRTKAPPPRWKMALVTGSAIFPLVLLSSHTVAPLLGPWLPPTLVVLVATGLIVAAMTWFVMPALVRLLVAWLYPAEPDS